MGNTVGSNPNSPSVLGEGESHGCLLGYRKNSPLGDSSEACGRPEGPRPGGLRDAGWHPPQLTSPVSQPPPHVMPLALPTGPAVGVAVPSALPGSALFKPCPGPRPPETNPRPLVKVVTALCAHVPRTHLICLLGSVVPSAAILTSRFKDTGRCLETSLSHKGQPRVASRTPGTASDT